jgi:hypothetical protein
VATVIPTPTILRASDNLIYMTGSSKLVINGTNFREKVTTTTKAFHNNNNNRRPQEKGSATHCVLAHKLCQ